MAVNRGVIILLVSGIFTVADFECPVVEKPISFTGDNTHSINFLWDCLVLPNEDVLGVTWAKGNTLMATDKNNTFESFGSYIGRVDRIGTCGISLRTISLNDSGRYNITVLVRLPNGTLQTSCHSTYLPVFKCPVTKEPIIFIGDNTHSVTFTWNCSFLPIASVLYITWFKEYESIASAVNITFTPNGSYAGRMERFGPFGILLHNISLNDSGHYSMYVLLNRSFKDKRLFDTECNSAYLPALPEELMGNNARKGQVSANKEQSSLNDQHGPSKLEVGLICGFVPMTIIGLGIVLWCFRRKICNTNHMVNESMSPEDSKML